MGARPTHIYASTLRRRDLAWRLRRRRMSAAVSSPLARLLVSGAAGVGALLLGRLAG